MHIEIKNIFETIERNSPTQKTGPTLNANRIERVFELAATTSLIVTVALVFYEPWRVAALLSAFAFLLILILLTLMQASTIARSFKAPLKGYSSQSEERLTRRVQYIQRLAEFNPENIQLAARAIQNDVSYMQKRLYLLVGAIEKAGFIPAGLALFYAATESTSGNGDLAAYLLMAFIFGLYGGAFFSTQNDGVP